MREYTREEFFQDFGHIPLSRLDVANSFMDYLLNIMDGKDGVDGYSVGKDEASFDYKGRKICIRAVREYGKIKRVSIDGNESDAEEILDSFRDFIQGTDYGITTPGDLNYYEELEERYDS